MRKYAPIFLLPTMIAFTIGFIAPFILGMYLSFCEFTIVSDAKLVGLKNYLRFWNDSSDVFLHSLWYTSLFTIVTVILINVLAFAVALALTKKIRGTNLFRTVFFMPNLIGGLILGYVWQLLLNGVLAMFQRTLKYSEVYGFFGLVILMLWQQIGYMMIIYIAGIQNVPGELIEAAKIVKQYGFDKMDASEMKKKNPTSEAPSNEGSDLHSMDVSKLLTDAKKLAAGDKTLIALAESVNKSTRATSPNGIQGERIWLGANSSTTYMATRKKGELSVYSAVPEKSYCDIDICVYDDYEDEVICDTRSNSSARVSWYCSRSQTYEVEISNESDYGTYVTVSSTRR